MSPKSGPAETGYVPAFDGLRAIACLTVFLANFHHALGMNLKGRIGPFDLTYFAESGVGVVLFMVLSGCLLSGPFWQLVRKERQRVNWQSFALKRALRMVPPYYACLVVLLIGSGESHSSTDVIVHFLFVNNLWETSFYSFSQQFWTIGMFVQFYCLLPPLLAGVRRVTHGAGTAAAILIGIATGAYLLHLGLMLTRDRWVVWPVTVLASPNGYVIGHSTLAHLPHFVLGVAGGYFLAALRNTTAVAKGVRAALCELSFWASFLGLMLLASVPAADALQLPYGRYLFPWMPVLATLAIVTLPGARLASALLGVGPLRWLGIISYGVYIYHVTCMEATMRLSRAASFDPSTMRLEFGIVSFALTVLVAAASYVLLERPILRWSRLRDQQATA
ncbi:MAG: acyltransferase [Vicinamibacterales bacterium]